MMASRLLISVAALVPIAAAVAQSPNQGGQPSQQPVTFESLDADSDGRISKTEAAANTNISANFAQYDQNANGFIEKEEVTRTSSPPPPTPKELILSDPRGRWAAWAAIGGPTKQEVSWQRIRSDSVKTDRSENT